MKQLLIALCMIGGTWFLVSTHLKNNENGNRPLVTEKVPAQTLIVQNKRDFDQLQPIKPAAGQSGHAIVPDRPPALVAKSESPSQPEKKSPPEIGPTPRDRLQVKSEARIRSGPMRFSLYGVAARACRKGLSSYVVSCSSSRGLSETEPEMPIQKS